MCACLWVLTPTKANKLVYRQDPWKKEFCIQSKNSFKRKLKYWNKMLKHTGHSTEYSNAANSYLSRRHQRWHNNTIIYYWITMTHVKVCWFSIWWSGMVAGRPGLHGAIVAAVAVSVLKWGSAPATTPHLVTEVESVLAKVEKRGEKEWDGKGFTGKYLLWR